MSKSKAAAATGPNVILGPATTIYRKEKLEKQVRLYSYHTASDIEKAKLPLRPENTQIIKSYSVS